MRAEIRAFLQYALQEMMIMRTSGILYPVSSLPSKYGIGCFSKEAYEFVDFLKKAGQTCWQVLPFGPTGYGAPYKCQICKVYPDDGASKKTVTESVVNREGVANDC